MAITYGFYNSLDHDRVYDAEQLSSMFDGLIVDGVFMTIGGTLMVTPSSSGLAVDVASGKAWFNHTWTLNDASITLALETAETLLPRIDTVVVEVNTSTRVNSIKIIKGTPASSPVAPTLTKANYVYQFPLANISVAANATSLTTANITNRIGTSDCPWVTGITEGIDATDLYAKWEAQWNASMSGMSATFDSDQAARTTAFNSAQSDRASQFTTQKTNFDTEFNDWFNSVKGLVDEDTGVKLASEMVEVKAQADAATAAANSCEYHVNAMERGMADSTTVFNASSTNPTWWVSAYDYVYDTTRGDGYEKCPHSVPRVIYIPPHATVTLFTFNDAVTYRKVYSEYLESDCNWDNYDSTISYTCPLTLDPNVYTMNSTATFTGSNSICALIIMTEAYGYNLSVEYSFDFSSSSDLTSATIVNSVKKYPGAATYDSDSNAWTFDKDTIDVSSSTNIMVYSDGTQVMIEVIYDAIARTFALNYTNIYPDYAGEESNKIVLDYASALDTRHTELVIPE